jgi:tetratricopeptide (TPR) repeat protein
MENAKVWIDKVMIPTYKLFEEDLNPMLDERLDPYPYALQNDRSCNIEDIEHEAIMLENDFLKLMVLPNFGGRLLSVYDKINNREVFYRNSVIKPRMIGTRGAWISGGVEFNFPISHSPNTMDRVNYLTKTYDDGSAAIEFGNIELMSRMNWKVELRLYKHKAYIEQNVNLYNPTRELNRFYFWTNAAVDFDKSTKLLYPFDWCINHMDPHYIKWPFYKGRDYSNLHEVPYAYETFGKLMNENFFGAYSLDKHYGVIHYADRKVLKGAKFFTWGNDELSDVWNAALTDDDSKYLEIQSGPFESQMVYKFMKPHQEIKWSEYWYPISNTGGLVHAGKEVAVNLEINNNGIDATLYSVESIKNCKVLLKIGGKTSTRVVKLECGKIHKEFFELKEPLSLGEFSLDIYGAGKHLVSIGSRDEFIEEQLDNGLYEDSRVVRGQNYSEKIIDCATFHASLGRISDAVELYKKNLAQNPNCTVTLNRLGSIYLKEGLFAEGEECFKKVLALDNRNSEARFMMASIQKERGNYTLARRLFEDISCDCEYYKPSIIELAKMSIYLGYYKDAYDTLAANDCSNRYCNFLKCIALRKDDLECNAKNILENTFIMDEYILCERFIIGIDKMPEGIYKYTKGDEKVLVNLALEYAELGLWEDAGKIIDLVSKPGIKTRILKQKITTALGNPLFENLEQALDVSLDYAFLNEKLLISFIEQSLAEDLTGKAEYLLGTYYHAKGRKDEAITHYLISYKKGLRYTALLRNIGLLYFGYKNDLDEAIRYLKEDIDINKEINTSSLSILYKIYDKKQDLEGRKSLLPYMQKAKNKSTVMTQMVDILRDSGRIDEALSVLENQEFENWEGAENSGKSYKETIIALAMKAAAIGDLAKALECIEKIDKFPKRLNFGNSNRTPLTKEHYYKGIIYFKNGLREKAIEEFKEGAFEIDNTEIMHTAESMQYAMKCLNHFKKCIK